ncbi:unnamed protein product [Prunus armeniaca]
MKGVVFLTKYKPYSTMWSEEETWKGQLGCYVKGSKIALLIMEGGRDLAERWEEEQSKLLSGICVPQFKYSIAQGSSLDYHYFLGPKTGIWK